MLADVSLAQGAQERVAQGMAEDIGVGVAQEPLLPRDLHTAENQLASRHKPVNVYTLTNTKRHTGPEPTGWSPSVPPDEY